MFDISGHRKEEKEKASWRSCAASRKRTDRCNELLYSSSVLSGISHEMRTDMNAVVAFSYLLSKTEFSNGDKSEITGQVYNSCEKVISLLDNFLDFALLDSGNSEAGQIPVYPNESLTNLFSEFRKFINNKALNDLIFVSESQSVDNSEYFIDMKKVERVIRNLFHLALANTKSGYIKSGYELRSECFTFYILDSGTGYSKCREFLESNNLDKSLSLFNDVSSAVSIALIRKLVFSMKGSLRIECNGLSGCGIFFSLPVKKVKGTQNAANKLSNTMTTI